MCLKDTSCKQRIKMSKYFPKSFRRFGIMQQGITNISHVDTSSFASKTNLATLKTEVDKLTN